MKRKNTITEKHLLERIDNVKDFLSGRIDVKIRENLDVPSSQILLIKRKFTDELNTTKRVFTQQKELNHTVRFSKKKKDINKTHKAVVEVKGVEQLENEIKRLNEKVDALKKLTDGLLKLISSHIENL